ncbi:MAG: HlyD family secretion protein [Pyrinomonadaceae bacterium]
MSSPIKEVEEVSPDSSKGKEIIETEEVIHLENVSSKRSRTPIYVVGVIVVLFLIGGLSWWLYSRQFEKTDDAFIEGNISLITSKVASHIGKVHVKENQFVKKGELIVELDGREFESKLEQAQAILKTAMARRLKAVASYDMTRKTSRSDYSQASSGVSTAKNNIEQTRIVSDTKLNAVEQSKLRARTAESTFYQVQSQIPAAEAALEQAKAQIPAAQTRLENAELEYKRSLQLFNGGDLSRQELERDNRSLSEARANKITTDKQVDISKAQSNALVKQSEVEKARSEEAKNSIIAAENDYRQSLSQINIASSQADEAKGKLIGANVLPEQTAIGESEIQTVEAEIAQAQAAVNQAQLELDNTKIFAPQDGYVSRKAVVEGQLVQTDQPLMSISLPGIWVIANFKETQIEQMNEGQAVDIFVDAYPNTTFHGKIESFQIGTGSRFSVLPAENASGNYVKVVQRIPVKVVFDEPPAEKFLLVPGMSVVPRVRVR